MFDEPITMLKWCLYTEALVKIINLYNILFVYALNGAILHCESFQCGYFQYIKLATLLCFCMQALHGVLIIEGYLDEWVPDLFVSCTNDANITFVCLQENSIGHL